MIEDKRKWNEERPFWVEHGKYLDYYWFQSNYSLYGEFLELCPETLRNKWAAMTNFDNARMTPFVASPESPDVWMGGPKLISSFDDLPWSGNEDEFYVFDEPPAPEKAALLGKDLVFGKRQVSVMVASSDPQLPWCWERIIESGAETYLIDDPMQFVATRNEELATRFLESEIFKSIPNLHIDVNRQALQGWLEIETTGEVCGMQGCTLNRIKYGANCPRHHFEMLFATKFPDELL